MYKNVCTDTEQYKYVNSLGVWLIGTKIFSFLFDLLDSF